MFSCLRLRRRCAGAIRELPWSNKIGGRREDGRMNLPFQPLDAIKRRPAERPHGLLRQTVAVGDRG